MHSGNDTGKTEKKSNHKYNKLHLKSMHFIIDFCKFLLRQNIPGEKDKKIYNKY